MRGWINFRIENWNAQKCCYLFWAFSEQRRENKKNGKQHATWKEIRVNSRRNMENKIDPTLSFCLFVWNFIHIQKTKNPINEIIIKVKTLAYIMYILTLVLKQNKKQK